MDYYESYCGCNRCAPFSTAVIITRNRSNRPRELKIRVTPYCNYPVEWFRDTAIERAVLLHQFKKRNSSLLAIRLSVDLRTNNNQIEDIGILSSVRAWRQLPLVDQTLSWTSTI